MVRDRHAWTILNGGMQNEKIMDIIFIIDVMSRPTYRGIYNAYFICINMIDEGNIGVFWSENAVRCDIAGDFVCTWSLKLFQSSLNSWSCRRLRSWSNWSLAASMYTSRGFSHWKRMSRKIFQRNIIIIRKGWWWRHLIGECNCTVKCMIRACRIFDGSEMIRQWTSV